jgi:hypothetical protein
LELSHSPNLRNRRQVLEREYLGQLLVNPNSSSSSNSNNLQALVPSGSHNSQPQLGPAFLVQVAVVRLVSRTSPPLASGVAPSGQQQVARSVLQELLDSQPASLLQVPQAFLANPNSSNNLQLGAHSVVLVRIRLPNRRFSVSLLKVVQHLPALARLAISSSHSHSNLSSNLSSRKRVAYSETRVVAYLASPSSSSRNLNRLGYSVPPQPNLKVACLEVRRRVEVYLGTSNKISSRPNSPLNRVGFLGPNQPLAGGYLEIRLVKQARREQSARNPKRILLGSLQVKQRTSNQQLGRMRSAHPCLAPNPPHRGSAPRHQRVAHYLEMDNHCLVSTPLLMFLEHRELCSPPLPNLFPRTCQSSRCFPPARVP